MPLSRNLLMFSCLLFMPFLCACDTQVPQTINVRVSSDLGPITDMPLRLYESFRACEGTFVEGHTDEKGAFRFDTVTTRGGIAEVTQSIALCAEKSGRWEPLWSTITGGGAESMDLECGPNAVARELRSAADEFCELTVR